jgi:NAD(P)-dependent dehydrogenase (short-subunit alcohol dehydrogenase family)
MNTPVVLITGALTGIGRATAMAFAKGGASVVVSGRREDAGRALAAELRTLGAQAEFVQADVRHEDEIRSLVDQTVKRFGRLDVAVNNAGTEGRPGGCPTCASCGASLLRAVETADQSPPYCQ